VEELDQDIHNKLCQTTEHYFFYGYALAKLKFQYYAKCSICTLDVFVMLSCKRCSAASKKQHMLYINNMKNLKLKEEYCQDYINFLIRFAGLCCKSPKLKKIPCEPNKIKKYIGYLSEQLDIDQNIWT